MPSLPQIIVTDRPQQPQRFGVRAMVVADLHRCMKRESFGDLQLDIDGAGDLARLQQWRDLAIGETIDLGKRSEEHTSELQSLMRISYAVFCLKKKNR